MPYTILSAGLHFTHVQTKLPLFGNKILWLSASLYCSIRKCKCQPGWFISLGAVLQGTHLTKLRTNPVLKAQVATSPTKVITVAHVQCHSSRIKVWNWVILIFQMATPSISVYGVLNAQQFRTTDPYLCLPVDEVKGHLRSSRHVLV